MTIVTSAASISVNPRRRRRRALCRRWLIGRGMIRYPIRVAQGQGVKRGGRNETGETTWPPACGGPRRFTSGASLDQLAQLEDRQDDAHGDEPDHAAHGDDH